MRLVESLFAFAFVLFMAALPYSFAAARGNWRGWNRSMTHGYVAGEPVGNLIVVIHITSAVLLLLIGAIQFVPQVRSRAPAFHRWNGRVAPGGSLLALEAACLGPRAKIRRRGTGLLCAEHLEYRSALSKKTVRREIP